MRLPTRNSLKNLVDELNQKNYLEDSESTIKTELEFPEQKPAPVENEEVIKIIKCNYSEPSKQLQSLYESQFRSFSRVNDDSFECIV